ncbi:MAG TPA: hypothetical protein VN618_01165 [Solirubrobacteraceae bacterium]|nr:hypothetical protein [Solirubrobacteraceae bacterium]
MRFRCARCLLVTAPIALGLAAAARATPTIDSLKASVAPIPGFPGTGTKPGAGAALKGSVKISGTEYGDAPSPLLGIDIALPSGTRLHPQGFATCSTPTLQARGPQGCPKSSSAGSGGWALGTVTFGGERVPERATLQEFFAPGGGLEVYVFGHTPALVEVIGEGHVEPPTASTGPQVVGRIPLIETVPEGFDASFREGAIEFGAARREGRKVIPYLTLPKHCPTGGWTVKVTMSFLGGGEVAAMTKLGCPHV